MGRPLNSRYFGADDTVPASITVDFSGGGVTGVALIDGGAGYTPSLTGETFTLQNTGTGPGIIVPAEITYDTTVGGAVTNVSVTGAGSGYDDATDVPVDGDDLPVPTNDSGKQILGTAWIPGRPSAAEVFIVKQKSSRKFQVAEVAAPNETGVVITANTGTPASGEFSIPVAPSDGAGDAEATEYARIITGRRVRTFDGNVYAWGDLVINSLGEGGPGSDFTPE